MNLIYETDRLILKVLRPEAAKKVLCFYLDNKELFEKYEASRPDNFYTVKYQKSVLLCEYNLTVQLSAVRFYVFLKDDPDRIIGTICFRDITRSIYDSCEVGYKFDERFWHHGYATEAAGHGIQYPQPRQNSPLSSLRSASISAFISSVMTGGCSM